MAWAWVSLLTFYCFNRFRVSPSAVLSQPSTYNMSALPPFFSRCFQAWVTWDGSISGGDLVVGSSAMGGPFPISSTTTKACYNLLLSMNPARPPCVGKFLPLLGPWEWSSQPGLLCSSCPSTNKSPTLIGNWPMASCTPWSSWPPSVTSFHLPVSVATTWNHPIIFSFTALWPRVDSHGFRLCSPAPDPPVPP